MRGYSGLYEMYKGLEHSLALCCVVGFLCAGRLPLPASSVHSTWPSRDDVDCVEAVWLR